MHKVTAHLNIHLMGAPEIQISGKALTLNNFKARALLFYLAATGQSHSRDFLATLLWSEAPSSEAHHSLRSSIYRLRQALRRDHADTIVSSTGDLLSLQANGYQCDVIDFRRLLALGDEPSLTQAVALYRGSFLQGFTLADASSFDDWVQVEHTRLSQACFDTLNHLTTILESREELSTAIRCLQQMIQIDPLAENAHQRLMRSYLLEGEVSQAVRQYRLFESRLQKELNLTPSLETLAIYHEALRQQRSPATFMPILNPSRLQSNSLPFIGRDVLIQQLLTISHDSMSGHGMTVLLQGEGGIGKSRLLDELASRLIAESTPWTVLNGACSPFDDLLSHGPFLEALQNASSSDLLAESATTQPDARGRFFWSVLQTIRSLSKSAPVLLAIDDLQWANSSTLNLFGFLAMRLHHLPVVLIGTVQRAEAIPALQRLITLGRRRGELHFLPLAPLTLESISGLIHNSGLNPTSDDTLAEWLHTRSAGNPFLLTEIIAQLRTERIIELAGSGWQLDSTHWLRWRTTFRLPETAHDLVAWRLANLSQDARKLLDILAVFGQPLPVQILHELPDITADSLIPLVDDLAERGLIVELPNAMLALPHHLLRETLLHQLSNLRRRSIHQQLAKALESRAVPESDLFLRQIAVHAVAGEDIDRARRCGLRVLTDLPWEYTGAETLDFVHHLYDLLAPSASIEEMILLTGGLGTLHQSLGDLEVAAHWHQQNLNWAQKTGDIAAQSEAYFNMAELALMSNDYHTATQTAQAGLEKIKPTEDSPLFIVNPLIGRGHRLLGAALAMEGSNLTAAEDELQKAVVEHRRTGNQGDLCATLFELGNIAAQRGELQAALKLYDESAHAAESGHIHYYLALARNNFAYHSLLLGEVDAAQQAASQGVKVAETYELLAALLHLYSTQGEIHLYLAEWEQAEESFRRGLALAEELGSLERQSGYRGGSALAARGRNDLNSGVHLLKEALSLIADQGYWHLRTRLQLWLAEILFEQQDPMEAAQLLDEAVEIARTHHRTLLLIQAHCLRARFLAAGGDWLAARALFAETLESASKLGLPLEIARVQTTWGKTALKYSADPEEGRTLMATACTILVDHNARADLAALTDS